MGRNGNSPFTHCGMRDSAVDNFIKENTMLYRISGLTAVLFAAASFVGCADTETPAPPPVVADGNGHNHGGGGHEHAETFGEAFAEVNELHENVAKAFADGDTEAAHGPLHEVGHLLDELSELADESEMSDEAKKTIDANIAVLFDTFGAVDKKMHDAEGGKDFSEVAEEISGAIAAIKEAAGEHAEAGHDEHGEHEGQMANTKTVITASTLTMKATTRTATIKKTSTKNTVSTRTIKKTAKMTKTVTAETKSTRKITPGKTEKKAARSNLQTTRRVSRC